MVNPAIQDKKRYLKLSVQGSNQHAIIPPEEVAGFTDNIDEYIVDEVWMTQAEYESLREFEGY